nr:metallophosphoesterase [Thermotoga sp.]
MSAVDEEPDVSFAINTGDMVFDGSVFKWGLYLKQLKKFKVPVLHVPGNHDPADNLGNYLKIFGPLHYSFHAGNSYFTVLNSVNEERVDSYQLAWLK